jgi:LytS/YehU family sensor histidine kinase
MSTQLLLQPFVWRNFGWEEVLQAWSELLVQRAVVAVPIALAIAAASRVASRTLLVHAAWLCAAILAGALVGELVLICAGSLVAPPDAWSVLIRVAQWFMLAISISTLSYMSRRASATHAAAQTAELHRTRMERQIVQARLQTLRSQIEPHFLFNTLATVRRLHETEPEQGERLLVNFLEYLRLTLPERHHGHNTLRQEIDLVRAYLGMVSVRMAGRLALAIDIPEELQDCEFPALTVATLVENAVKHGVGPAPNGGRIEVTARRIDESIELVVSDTGVGFSGSGGSGIGLANIRARLHTLYGASGVLSLVSNSPHGVRAAMRIPTAVGTDRE